MAGLALAVVKVAEPGFCMAAAVVVVAHQMVTVALAAAAVGKADIRAQRVRLLAVARVVREEVRARALAARAEILRPPQAWRRAMPFGKMALLSA